MRVLVACDAIGPLDSHQAGVAIARGWADRAEVAVVPLADAGLPLGGALAVLLGGEVVVEADQWWLRTSDTLVVGSVAQAARDHPEWRPGESSAGLGAWLDARLGDGPPPSRVVIDLTANPAVDGGAGLLAALGADAGVALDKGLAGLAEAEPVDLSPVRSRLDGIEVIGVVDADESGLGVLGLRGMVAQRGYAARLDPAEVIAAESTMARWLAVLGLPDAPGTGAAGGAAAAILALGGRLVRGSGLCTEIAGLERTAKLADLVITGCTAFHIGNRGGRLVRFVADLADTAGRPCLVFALESTVSRREMRSFGVEAAYGIGPGSLPEALTTAVVRLARGWTALSEPGVHWTTEGIADPGNGLDRVTKPGKEPNHDD